MKAMLLQTIVIATRNKGKLREFRNLLRPLNCEVLSLADLDIRAEIEESGRTFAENARLKAIEYSRLVEFTVVADDSGLEVEALGGRPGIHSARYAGAGASDEDRIRKLLGELAGISTPDGRRARFVCALAVAQKGNLLLETEGECRGIITEAARGTNGFGYDPVFLFPELDRTYAELNEAEKDQYSHRARAVASLLEKLK